MDNIEDIEHKLKQGASKTSFEYKEEYWDAALATLIQAEKSNWWKKFLLWFFILGFGVGFSMYGFYLFVGDSQVKEIYSPRETSNKISEDYFLEFEKGNTDLYPMEEGESSLKVSSKKSNVINPSNSNNSGVTQSKQIISNKRLPGIDENKLKVSNKSKQAKINSSLPAKKIASLTVSKNKNSLTTNGVSKTSNTFNNQENASEGTSSVFYTSTGDKEKVLVYQDFILDASVSSKQMNLLEPEPIQTISLEKNNRLSLVLNVGTTLSKSLTQNNYAFDFPYAGLELYYQINNKWNVSIGGAWYAKTNLDYTIPSSESSLYSYGITSKLSYTKLNALYFIETPLKVSYQWRRNHLIGLGMSYSYILGGKSTENIALSGNDAQGEFSTESTPDETKGLYPNLFVKGTFDPFISYEYRYKRLGVEARYYYGGNDFTKTYLSVQEKEFLNEKHRNTRFLLTFKYLLIKCP